VVRTPAEARKAAEGAHGADEELGRRQTAFTCGASAVRSGVSKRLDWRQMPELTHLPSEAEVMDALSNVIDPELGLDFVELGLIYGVEIDDGHVRVTFTLTTPGCPIGPQVTEQIDEFVGEVEGVKSIESEMVFTPPWSPEKMSEDAKFALGF
jgi:metal-sulfur cluster biosynthetic enzyme